MPKERGGNEPGMRQAPVERLWERSREGRKETNSKAKYEEPGKKARETRPERTGKTGEAKAETEHRGSSCKAEPGRNGKEEQRLSSQNPKLKRTKESENSGGQKEKRKRQSVVEVESQRNEGKRRKRSGTEKGEPGQASAENEAGGRRKEIADEACMKLSERRGDPKPQFRVRWKKVNIRS